MKKRILVGMSGGVDSALAAALLKREGWDVVGVTLQLYSYDTAVQETDVTKQHCHPNAFIHAAQEVAEQLKIPHHVVDRQELFQSEIINPFMKSYQQGKTPLPCARCNRDVKTQVMYDLMKTFEVTALATGHYVRRLSAENRVQLHQGADLRRDQSFFLFALPPYQLDLLHFPLGQFSKEETRQKARDFSLAVADTPSSQDLCFISKRSYKTLFQFSPGDIFHEDGRHLGSHDGLEKYTIGQRQGIGVGGHGDPLYVVALDAKNNQVIVGPRASLACSILHLEEINWLGDEVGSFPKSYTLEVKIRSSGIRIPARLQFYEDKVTVVLERPEYGVAIGQACVFYEGTRLMGGGWIYATGDANLS